MIDTQADDGAWAEALAAPCSFRTTSDYNPEPELGSHRAAGTLPSVAPHPIPAPPFHTADHPGCCEARPACVVASACGCPVHAFGALKDGNGAFFQINHEDAQ